MVDSAGNAFSATPSDVSWEGPVIPGLGLCPSSRGSQSWGDPAHPSAAAPGKRPRLTPNPSMAMRKGEFLMPFGSPGGDLQPQGMLQALVNHLVFGMDIQQAVEAPRFVTRNFPDSFEPHTYYPGRLDLEQAIGQPTGDALGAMGHKVNWAARSLAQDRQRLRRLRRPQGRQALRRGRSAPHRPRDGLVKTKPELIITGLRASGSLMVLAGATAWRS